MTRRLAAVTGALGIWAGLLLGCSSSVTGPSGPSAPSGPSGPSGSTGSLTVTISAPAGVTPSVAVSGPAGYHQMLAATQTLTGLAAGSYTVTAASAFGPNPIVGTAYAPTVTGGAASVVAGATATATVSYAARPGSGALWVMAGDNSALEAFAASQLAASNAAAPAVSLAISMGTAPIYLAFDAAGNLWLSEASANAIVELTPSQLGTSGSPTPTITVSASAGSLDGPEDIAFDASGNLWVANFLSNTVVEFTASQLATGGSPAPAVTLSASAGSLDRPVGLAFDASGDLWVSNLNSSTVVDFSASQLRASGSPTPAVMLSASSGSLSEPTGLAFDAGGNLWVGNATGNTLVEFTTSQLVASGSPTPAVTVGAVSESLHYPGGLAFDASGDLWVTNDDANTVVEFGVSQLAASGTPTPIVTLSNGAALAGPFGLAFDPGPANVPVNIGPH